MLMRPDLIMITLLIKWKCRRVAEPTLIYNLKQLFNGEVGVVSIISSYLLIPNVKSRFIRLNLLHKWRPTSGNLFNIFLWSYVRAGTLMENYLYIQFPHKGSGQYRQELFDYGVQCIFFYYITVIDKMR